MRMYVFSHISYLYYFMESRAINSVEELLRFFKQTTTKIFYIGPFYSITAVCLNDYIPTFEMVTCCDPFKGALPFVKVLQCFKQHTCVGIGCQNIILRQQEVISYLKGKSENPNIIVFDPDSQTERICQENGFNCWVIPSQLHGVLENKVKIIDLLKKAGIPFIPNVISTIQSYQNLKDLAKKFKTEKIVIQDENGYGGNGTIFIFNENDYNSFKSVLQNGKIFKIAAFRNLKPFQVSAVATNAGTFVGPLVADMIGHEQLVDCPAGYCGNQIRNKFYEDPQINQKVQYQITKYARILGEFLYKQGLYKGYYGLDFAVDIDTNEIFFMEMNARLTGPTAITFMIYEAQGHKFPIYLYHCAQYLGLKLNLDIEAINSQWSKPRHFQSQISLMILRPTPQDPISIPFLFPASTWKIDDGKLYCLNKCIFRLSELEEDEFLFVPAKGTAMASLIMKRITQDYSFKLLQDIKPLIHQFRELRIKGKAQ